MIIQDDPRSARSDQHNARQSQLYLIFRQGKNLFGLSLSSIREVLPVVENSLTAVPNTDETLLGLFNLRGEILPVMDFGLMASRIPTDTTSDSSRVMVMDIPLGRKGQSKSIRYGLAISQIITVSELWLDEIASAHEVGSTLTPILQGLYGWQNHLLMLLDGLAITNTFKHY